MPVGVMEDSSKEDIILNNIKREVIITEILTGNSHQLAVSSTKLTLAVHHRARHQEDMELRRDSTVRQRQGDTRHREDRHQCVRHSRTQTHTARFCSRLSKRRTSEACSPTQLSWIRSVLKRQERSSS